MPINEMTRYFPSNIVPGDCRFEFEFRYLPGADPDALEREIREFAANIIEPEMRKVDPNTGVSILLRAEIPGLNTGDTDRITYLAHALSLGKGTSKVAYATEAGLFQRAGIPSIICGPGSIDQAHKPNEWIALAQIAKCEAFMDRLVDEMRAKPSISR